MEVLVGPCADEPADDCRARKHQRDLKQFLGLHNGVDAGGHPGARVGILEWVMERHPWWLYMKDALRRDDARVSEACIGQCWLSQRPTDDILTTRTH